MFSTSFGSRSRRGAPQTGGLVVIRSDMHADAVQSASQYRLTWPAECKKIDNRAELRDYFDEYDIHMQGPEFLVAVLRILARQNQESKKDIEDFAFGWIQANPAKFQEMTDDAGLAAIFSGNEQAGYDQSFLIDALEVIKRLKKDKLYEEANRFNASAGQPWYQTNHPQPYLQHSGETMIPQISPPQHSYTPFYPGLNLHHNRNGGTFYQAHFQAGHPAPIIPTMNHTAFPFQYPYAPLYPSYGPGFQSAGSHPTNPYYPPFLQDMNHIPPPFPGLFGQPDGMRAVSDPRDLVYAREAHNAVNKSAPARHAPAACPKPGLITFATFEDMLAAIAKGPGSNKENHSQPDSPDAGQQLAPAGFADGYANNNLHQTLDDDHTNNIHRKFADGYTENHLHQALDDDHTQNIHREYQPLLTPEYVYRLHSEEFATDFYRDHVIRASISQSISSDSASTSATLVAEQTESDGGTGEPGSPKSDVPVNSPPESEVPIQSMQPIDDNNGDQVAGNESSETSIQVAQPTQTPIIPTTQEDKCSIFTGSSAQPKDNSSAKKKKKKTGQGEPATQQTDVKTHSGKKSNSKAHRKKFSNKNKVAYHVLPSIYKEEGK